MSLITIIIIALLTLPLLLRGGSLHTYLILESERILRQAGFHTYQEHPIRLPDGRLDFIDLLATQENFSIAIEAETSARHVLRNATKAEAIELPLWIIVPSRKVHNTITNTLAPSVLRPGGQRIYILLLGQLESELRFCFPLFFTANTTWKNKKTNHRKGDCNENTV